MATERVTERSDGRTNERIVEREEGTTYVDRGGSNIGGVILGIARAVSGDAAVVATPERTPAPRKLFAWR